MNPKWKCTQCGHDLLPLVETTCKLGGPQVCGECIDKVHSHKTRALNYLGETHLPVWVYSDGIIGLAKDTVEMLRWEEEQAMSRIANRALDIAEKSFLSTQDQYF